MPKKRSPQRDEAFRIWKEHNGEILLCDIAAQLGVPESSVRAWKLKDNWTGSIGTFHKNAERSETQKEQARRAKVNARVASEISAAPGLNDQEKDFCLHYLKTYNGKLSALHAGYSPNCAKQQAWTMLRRPAIQSFLQYLQQLRRASLLVDQDAIVERMMQIAFADMTDFVDVTVEWEPLFYKGLPVMVKDVEGKPIMMTYERNKMLFKPSSEMDGGLICEISQGKDGTKIKLEDRQKALEWLANYFMMNPMDRHRVAYDNKRISIEERKISDGDPDGDDDQVVIHYGR